jgi:uroporphyrinogen decarboxylase
MATPNEIVRDAFTGGIPEYVPVGINMGGSWPLIMRGYSLEELSGPGSSDPRAAAELFYEVNDELDSDFVTSGTGSTAFMLEALGAEIAFAEFGEPSITVPPIGSAADLEKADVRRIAESGRIRWIRDVTEELAALNGGKRSLFISARAPFTLAGQMFGVERFSKTLYRDRELAGRLLDLATDLSAFFYEYLLDIEGVDGVFIADPGASGDMISAKHYEELALSHFTELLSRLAPYGKLTLLHICGDITDRLTLIARSGVQMISLDCKVDLADAKEIVDGALALAGNVDPVGVMEDGSPDDVLAAARRCVEQAGGNGGFMLMPGCGISRKVTEENAAALVRAGHEARGGVPADGGAAGREARGGVPADGGAAGRGARGGAPADGGARTEQTERTGKAGEAR